MDTEEARGTCLQDRLEKMVSFKWNETRGSVKLVLP